MPGFGNAKYTHDGGGDGSGSDKGHSECCWVVTAAMTMTVLMALVLGVFRIQILLN